MKKSKDEIQAEGCKAFWDHGDNCTLVADMGSGKSRMGILIANQIESAKNILVVSTKKKITGKIDGGNIWEKELINYTSHHNFVTMTITKANNLPTDELNKYSIVIIDEIHEVLTEKKEPFFKKLVDLKISFFGLTGTPDDGNSLKNDMYKKYCPIIYRYMDSETDGVINKTKVLVYNHNLGEDEYTVATKTKSFAMTEKKAYNYFSSAMDDCKARISQFYYEGVVSRAKECLNKEISNEYRTKLSRLIKSNLDNFKSVYWAEMKSKQLPYDLYSMFRYIQGNDFTKLGTNAIAMSKGAPDGIRGMFFMYSWAMNNRRRMLFNLNSTINISKRIISNIDKKGEKVICFSEENIQAAKINKHCYVSANKDAKNILNLELFNKGSISSLGSSKALSAGTNLVNVKYGLIESFVGSRTRNAQNKGRLHRLGENEVAYCIIIRVMNTQSEEWFESIKDSFNTNDIKYFDNLNELIEIL